MAAADAMCPLRPGDMCRLCVPGATGPQDCPTLAEVMREPELRDRLAALRADRLAGLRHTGDQKRTASADG